MRYCPHCRPPQSGPADLLPSLWKNVARPALSSGPSNPITAQYCGDCGSADLTEPAGRRPFGPYLVKALILIMVLAFIIVIGRLFLLSFNPDTLAMLMRFIVILTLLLAGYWIVLSMAPRPIKAILQKMNRCLSQGLNRIGSLFVERLKEFLKLILNW